MPGYGIYNKLMRPDRTLEEANDSSHDQMIDQSVVSLGLLAPGERLRETLKRANSWTLADGTYPPFNLVAEDGYIAASGAAAVFDKPCVFNSSATVRGVIFTDAGALGAPAIVRIAADAKVCFVGCVFERSGSSTVTSIKVDNVTAATAFAGKATFLGCTFRGGEAEIGPAKAIVNSSGVAANVQVIGCAALLPSGASLAAGGTITETGTIS